MRKHDDIKLKVNNLTIEISHGKSRCVPSDVHRYIKPSGVHPYLSHHNGKILYMYICKYMQKIMDVLLCKKLIKD